MKNKVYALGFFDAFHKGHKRIIDKGLAVAKKLNTEFCLVTFDDNIYSVLKKPEKELYLFEERKNIAIEYGISEIIALPTSIDFMNKSSTEFLTFLNELRPAAFVVGADYHYGYGANGTVEELKSYFEKYNIQVIICDLLEENGEKLSTTRVKKLLTDGHIEKANHFLEQPYFITGTVVDGFKNGRKIGLPTANIDIDDRKFLPKSGVYMTKTLIDGQKYLSVSNVGMRPTFNIGKFNIETYILDFNDNIYQKNIKIEFYKYIREIRKFCTANDLANQIYLDIKQTRKELLHD